MCDDIQATALLIVFVRTLGLAKHSAGLQSSEGLQLPVSYTMLLDLLSITQERRRAL